MSTPVFSIVAPCYNEQENIPVLYERLTQVMNTIGEEWELILINDGSRDQTLSVMLEFRDKDSRIKIINFARNFGHQTAVTAGMDYSTGQAVILIDSDLQDPPELIAEMAAKWREGYDVVYGVRSERLGESYFKKATAKAFYRLIYRITDIDIPLDTGDFRLMDRRVVEAVCALREHNRFVRGLTSWVGFKQTGVTYVRPPRERGETHYPFKKMLRLAMDAITGFSYFPLQVAIYLSLGLAFLSVAAIPVVAILRLTTGSEAILEGQATTLSVLLLLTSFQLLFSFILGQYVARIYDETRNRPLYVVSDTYGLKKIPPYRVVGPASYLEDENEYD